MPNLKRFFLVIFFPTLILCSLEEKMLSLEDENHVLRQKALSAPLKSNRPGFAKSLSEVSCPHAYPHFREHI